MFAGVRAYDLPLGDAAAARGARARGGGVDGSTISLTHLTLSGVLPDGSRRAAFRSLADALVAGAAAGLPLTHLDWSHNDGRDAAVGGAAQVAAALPHALETLDLTQCHAGRAATAALAAALDAHHSHAGSLQVLRLGGNEVGKGGGALASFLRRAAALRELSVGGSACSVAAVAASLAHGAPQLATLDVSAVRLGRADVAALVALGASSAALTSLSVARCGVEADAVLAIGQALQLNPRLSATALDASGNALGAVGGYLLAAALPTLSKLTALHVDEIGRGPDLPPELAGGSGSRNGTPEKDSSPADGGNSFSRGRDRSNSSDAAKAAAPGAAVLLLEALAAAAAALPALTSVALGHTAVGTPDRLATALHAFLIGAPQLKALYLAGSGASRLRGALTPLVHAVAEAAAAGGAQLSVLDVSGHQSGDGVVSALRPLLDGDGGPRTLLCHGNALTVSGFEQLGEAAKEAAVEALVVTQEDARVALDNELSMKRPKDHAVRRLRAAVDRVRTVVQANRARRQLYPTMRHPRVGDGGAGLDAGCGKVGGVLKWPDWARLSRDEAAGAAAAIASPAWIARGSSEEVSGREEATPRAVAGGRTAPSSAAGGAAGGGGGAGGPDRP